MLLSLSGNIIQGSSLLLILFFVIKIILWVSYKSSDKPGILPSFLMFFSKVDIHDAENKSQRIFLKWSNRINLMTYLIIAFMVVGFALDVNQDMDTDKNPYHDPVKREKYREKTK